MRWFIDARSLTDSTQGGVSRVTRGIVSAFIENASDDEIILVTTGSMGACIDGEGGMTPPLQGKNCRHVHIRMPNKLWSLLCLMRIASLDRAVERKVGKIDGVFLPNLGFVGPLHRPYTLLLHDLSFLIEPRWFSRKMRLWHRAVDAKKLIRGAASLLAVSETTKRDAVRLLGIPEGRISVIPIGSTLSVGAGSPRPPTEAERTGRGDPAPTSPRYVLILGATDPRKNTRTALLAVEELRKEPAFADLEAVVVGGTIRPTDAELASLYTNAAVFLYPSWYEGYGLPLHEAASFGTPCIASTAGALPETAPAGTIFADPAKPHHWVEALRLALTRPPGGATQRVAPTWIAAAEFLNDALKQALH